MRRLWTTAKSSEIKKQSVHISLLSILRRQHLHWAQRKSMFIRENPIMCYLWRCDGNWLCYRVESKSVPTLTSW